MDLTASNQYFQIKDAVNVFKNLFNENIIKRKNKYKYKEQRNK